VAGGAAHPAASLRRPATPGGNPGFTRRDRRTEAGRALPGGTPAGMPGSPSGCSAQPARSWSWCSPRAGGGRPGRSATAATSPPDTPAPRGSASHASANWRTAHPDQEIRDGHVSTGPGPPDPPTTGATRSSTTRLTGPGGPCAGSTSMSPRPPTARSRSNTTGRSNPPRLGAAPAPHRIAVPSPRSSHRPARCRRPTEPIAPPRRYPAQTRSCARPRNTSACRVRLRELPPLRRPQPGSVVARRAIRAPFPTSTSRPHVGRQWLRRPLPTVTDAANRPQADSGRRAA
jgi:hypothetical protein